MVIRSLETHNNMMIPWYQLRSSHRIRKAFKGLKPEEIRKTAREDMARTPGVILRRYH
jgi:hypothetical protein